METALSSFTGIWPALLTPLDVALNVNHAALVQHSKTLLQAGCSGVTPFGTTGEGPSFTVEERIQAVDALVAGGVPAAQILVSTSAAALPDVVRLTRHALDIGAHGTLLLPPFFLKGVPDAGVVDSYAWVMDAVAAHPRAGEHRLYLYHIPQVSGVGLSDAVIRELKKRYPRNVVGLKDSGCERAPSLARAAAFMSADTPPPERVTIYVGNEPDMQVMAALGTPGAVSGVANVAPALVQRLVRDHAAATALADGLQVQDLLKVLFNNYGLTAAFKGIMALQTGDAGWLRVRPPLVALSDAEFRRLQLELKITLIAPPSWPLS